MPSHYIVPKWNLQSKSCRLRKIKIARSLLTRISGNDLCGIIASLLEKSEFETLVHKYITALKGIAAAVDETIKSKDKHHFIRPIRLAGFKMDESKQLGFKFSSDLWISCLDDSERHRGGHPAVSNEIVEEITTFMENITTEAANSSYLRKSYSKSDPNKKTITGEHIEPARCLQTSMADAYRQYFQLESNNKKIHKRTFEKLVSKRNFIKPTLSTDLCDYCEMGKTIQKQVKSFVEKYCDLDQEYTTDTLLNHLSNELVESKNSRLDPETTNTMIVKLKNLKSIEYHKSTATRQRSVYNKHRLDPKVLNGKIAIDIDYKQSIVLGKGHRQVNAEFYDVNKKKVVCLGFGVYYVDKSDPNNPFVNCMNIDVISDHEGQTASDMIRAFKHVMELPSFKNVDESEYLIWTDCGKQFRSSEFLYFLFNDLAEKNKRVNLNYFVEKHGTVILLNIFFHVKSILVIKNVQKF
jgi:hypothetical protein